MSAADTRLRLASATVARPDFPAGWLLMDHPEKGYRSFGSMFLTLEEMAWKVAVVFGEVGRDAEGYFVRVEPAPEHTPSSDEIEDARRRAWAARRAPGLSDLARAAAAANLAAWKLLLGLRLGAVVLPAAELTPRRPASLFGEIVADPELRRLPSGAAVLKLRLACRRSIENRDGEREETTEEHAVTVWGERAEDLSRVLRQGHKLMVEGRPREREHAGLELDADDVIVGPGPRP